MAWLREAYRRRKDGAAGVDGVTAAQYEAGLDASRDFSTGLGPVPGAAGAAGAHPEAGQGGEDEAAGHPDAGGQGSAACALEPIFERCRTGSGPDAARTWRTG